MDHVFVCAKGATKLDEVEIPQRAKCGPSQPHSRPDITTLWQSPHPKMRLLVILATIR